jgi:Mg-chelatase subunit ChlD
MLLSLLALSGTLPAQEDPCLNRAVIVNVLAQDGTPVRGLVATNFRARLRHRILNFDSVSLNVSSRRVVILIDVSGSMTTSTGLEASTEFANELIRSASPLVSFGLLTFTDRVQDRVDFSLDRKPFRDELTKLQTTNWSRLKGIRKTAWLDALMQALRFLEPARRGDAICILTDGLDNASTSRPRDVREALSASGARLFNLLVSDMAWFGPHAHATEEIGQLEKLQPLVAASGGDSLATGTNDNPVLSDPNYPRAITGDRRQAILSFARLVAQEIGEFYDLEIKLPSPLTKPQGWKLEVVDARGKTNNRLRVLYPRQLAACD